MTVILDTYMHASELLVFYKTPCMVMTVEAGDESGLQLRWVLFDHFSHSQCCVQEILYVNTAAAGGTSEYYTILLAATSFRSRVFRVSFSSTFPKQAIDALLFVSKPELPLAAVAQPCSSEFNAEHSSDFNNRF